MNYDCIIPAAGLSSRMGSWKLLLEYQELSIIEHAIRNAQIHCSNVIVCGGYRFQELKDKLVNYDNIIIVENTSYREGMITSIKAALSYVQSDSFFVALSDMPRIDPIVFRQMSQTMFSNALFPVFNGKRGHPVLISSKLIDPILRAPNSVSMKSFLKDFTVSELQVADENILFDVDNKNDYKKLMMDLEKK